MTLNHEEQQSMMKLVNEKVADSKRTKNHPRKERTITLICDYGQSVELHWLGDNNNVEETYCYSLNRLVHVFGIVHTKDEFNQMMTYCYKESVGHKGGNNVISLLMRYLKEEIKLDKNDPIRELNIIMDNSTGQNKNATVICLVAYLVDRTFFHQVNLVYYMAGPTKTS
jgi:hypothetical protein